MRFVKKVVERDEQKRDAYGFKTAVKEKKREKEPGRDLHGRKVHFSDAEERDLHGRNIKNLKPWLYGN